MYAARNIISRATYEGGQPVTDIQDTEDDQQPTPLQRLEEIEYYLDGLQRQMEEAYSYELKIRAEVRKLEAELRNSR